MSEGPTEPSYENKTDFSEVRKSVDSLVVAPAEPYEGPIQPLMSPYEPPAASGQQASADASGEE